MVNPTLHTSTKGRHPVEFYPTPDEFTEVLLRHVTPPHYLWECAVGNGAMANVLRRAGHQVIGTDVTTGTDFLRQDRLPADDVEGIITNPPFSLSLEFATHATKLARFVALLQPIYNLGGIKRYEHLWSAHPPYLVLIVSDRMRVDNRTSHFNHIWCVWDSNRQGGTTLIWDRT